MKLDKDKRRAIIGTILFHIILIISLIFLALRTPLPLPGEEGVEVSLGYDNVGMGKIQSKTPPPQQNTPTPKPKVEQKVKQPEPTPEAKQEQKILTQNTEKAPALEKKKKEPEKKKVKKPKKIVKPKKPIEKPEIKKEKIEPKPIEKAKPVPVVKPKPVLNKKALFKGSSKHKSGTGTNQGLGKQAGDQGKPHGFENSNKYNGKGGKGNGPAYDLGGRGAKFLDKPPSSFSETGTVVVSIWVDRSGKVIKAQVNPKGTTVLSAGLRRIAVEAAKNSTFVSDPEAATEQRGTITYNFIK